MSLSERIQITFGSPSDTQHITTFVTAHNNRPDANPMTVLPHDGIGTGSLVVEFAFGIASDIVAELISLHLKKSKAHWLAIGSRNPSHYTDESDVAIRTFLKSLEPAPPAVILYERLFDRRTCVQLGLRNIKDGDKAVFKKALAEIDCKIQAFSKTQDASVAVAVLTGAEPNAIREHLLTHRHFHPAPYFE